MATMTGRINPLAGILRKAQRAGDEPSVPGRSRARRRVRRLAVLSVGALGLGGFGAVASLLLSGTAQAGPTLTCTWTDGGSATNNNFSNASNWTAAGGATCGGSFASGDQLIFPSPIPTANSPIDDVASLTVDDMLIEAGYTIATSSASNVLTLTPATNSGVGIALTGSSNSAVVQTQIALGQNEEFAAATTASLTVSGAVSGSFALTVGDASNSGKVTLSGINAGYTGATTIASAQLQADNASALGNQPVTLTDPGSVVPSLDLQNTGTGFTLLNPVNFVSQGHVKDLAGGDTLGGAITLPTGTTVILYDGSTTSPFTLAGGLISGTDASLTTQSAGGTVVLSDAISASTGSNCGLFVGSGPAQITNASAFQSGCALDVAGTLDLDGNSITTGSTTVAGLSGAGTIFNNGSSNATLFDAGGTTTFSGVLKDHTTGSSDLGLTVDGGTLTLSGANNYSVGTTVTSGSLIEGAAGSYVNSTPLVVNGGTFDLGGNTIIVAGLSGTGGTILDNSATPATLTDSVGGSSFGGVIANGSGSLALTINVSGTTFTLSGANTYTGATTVQSGTLSLTNAASLGVTSGVVVNVPGILDLAGSTSFTVPSSIPITSLAGALVTTGGDTWSGSIALASTGGSLGANGAILSVAGAISGAGSLTVGPARFANGWVDLESADNYTGATVVQAQCYLDITNSQALGSTSGITVDPNTVLELAASGGSTYNYPLTLGTAHGAAGALLEDVATGDTWSGTVTLSAASTVNASNVFTISGPVSGTGPLTTQGAGTTVLTDVNTYSGGTTVTGGTLETTNASGLSTGSTTVASGAILDVANGITVPSANTLTLNGGTLEATGSSSVEWDGAITLGATSTFDQNTGSTFAIEGPISGGANGLVIGASGFTGVVELLPMSGGSCTNNVFTGGTTVFTSTTLTLVCPGAAGTLATDSITVGSAAHLNISAPTTANNIDLVAATSRLDVIAPSGTVTLSGAISGAGDLTSNTRATSVTLTGSNSYSGGSTLATATGASTTFVAGPSDPLAFSTGAMTVGTNATLDLNANNITVASLSGLGTILNNGGSIGTLTVDNGSGTDTFGGLVSNGTGTTALSTTGNNTLLLTNPSSTYSGGTKIMGTGALEVSVSSTGSAGSVTSGPLGTGPVSTINSGDPLWLEGGAVIANPLTLATGGILNAASGSDSYSGPITLSGTGYLLGQSSATLTVTNVVSGSVQALYIGTTPTGGADTGTVVLVGNNTYGGGTTITAGTLETTNGSGLGASSGSVTVDSPGTLDVALRASTVANSVVDNSVVDLNPTAGVTTMSGVISGSGTLASTGTDILTNTDNYGGATTVSTGVLDVTGTISASTVTVASGATLEGTGTIDQVASNLGTVAPGSASAPGVLSATGPVNLDGAVGTFQVNITGSSPGSGYSQLSSTSTVNNGSAVLSVTDSFAAPFGTRFTIVTSLAGSSPVSGNFSNAAPNAIITTTGGRKLQVSYGSNAVVLTDVTTPPPAGGGGVGTGSTCPTGTASCQSSTSVTPGGSATATNDGTTATASGGEGTVNVGQYSSDPVGSPAFPSSGVYLDVSLSSGNSFTSVTVSDCNLGGGSSLQWWNGTSWQAVVGNPGPTYSAGPPACLSVTLDATTSPNLTQLTGTVFGVANSSSAATVTGVSPTSGPAAGGTSVTITGTNFTGAITVDFGATPATGVAVVSSTQVTATSPAGSGTVHVSVTTPSGTSATSSADLFTYLSPTTTPTTTTTTTSANPASSTSGSPVTFTATVTPISGSGTPTGTVSFTVGSTALCTATLSGGAGSCASASAPVGTDTVVATYSGDASFAGSSGTTTLTVNKVTTPPNNGSLPAPVVGMASTPDGGGYWLTDAAGGVSPHGDAVSYGSMAGHRLNSPIAHIVATPDGHGYWLVASDGGVFSFGDAGFYGSMGGRRLNAPVVDLAPTSDGHGYWLVASDGGIFAFGDALFHGSMGGTHLNKPVVGIAPDYVTGGYWEVATDGGIFAFDAPFYGSTGATTLNKPVNGMTATADNQGYWFVASDGGIFAFGDAGFHGSMGGSHLNAPVVGMAADNATGGYWLVASDGGIFSFDAPFYGAD